MRGERTTTQDLPEGWSIVQPMGCSRENPFRLFKDGVHVASGDEYGEKTQWEIGYIAASETRPIIEAVMAKFRADSKARFDAETASFFAKCRADESKLADAARAVLGVQP